MRFWTMMVGRSTQNFGLSAAVFAISTLLLIDRVTGSGYCWDHQEENYNAKFKPAECDGGTCTVTPFFSPDTSVKVYVELIESAQSSIDIYTPSMKSWDEECTKNTDCPKRGSCTGCPVEEQKNESFPIFPALLNAVHERGVNVRIITNNFTFSACAGRVIPLDWFALNNIQIRMYSSTTFQHAKFIMVDKGKKTAVSSVNWSYTSFMRNREAGVILEECTCSAVSFYQSVFNSDWESGIDYVITRSYTEEEKKIITDTSHMSYTIPDCPLNGTFVTKLTPHKSTKVQKLYTSPDYSRDTLMTFLNETKKSLSLYIYQVTDMGLCNKLLELHNRGVNVTILVSHEVIPFYNYNQSRFCYTTLTNAGMKGKIQSANKKFQFSHQKYWIIDGTTVHLSTGNWSPGDFPKGNSWVPHRVPPHRSINRDLEIVLEQRYLVDYFYEVFNADWYMGEEWKPTPYQYYP